MKKNTRVCFWENKGAPALPFRVVLAALIIQERLGISDRETVEQIRENPYLQYFIGLKNYQTEIPSKRHRAVGKETGQTNHIERLNNTFRQRISRLVRESLSFSKKMENHVGEPFGILSMTTMHSKAKD